MMSNVDIGQRYKKIFRYIWDPEPKNDLNPDESIWCMGIEYRASNSHNPRVIERSEIRKEITPPSTLDHHFLISSQPLGKTEPSPPHMPECRDWPSSFLDDFESKTWATYRSNFPVISKSADPVAHSSLKLHMRLRTQFLDTHGFTSDTGWGCMIRSGQSLLANALCTLNLGRDWRRGSKTEEESALLSLFIDDPHAPFSIHRFVRHGASACGKQPGEWFGPSTTAYCIAALSSEYKQAGLNVYLSIDGPDVYEDRFRQIAGPGITRPTLILLAIRLGIDKVTRVYWEALTAVMRYPQSVGIAGGRPSSSFYFVGVQGFHFFYLDPHLTQSAVSWNPGSILSSDDVNSYHTRRLRRLHIKEMDPSMLIGFLIRNDQDWQDWKQRVRSVPEKKIIHVVDGEPPDFSQSIEREEALSEVEVLDGDN
ncbi:Cysteine protease atg4 [Ophidiomyces ophidiicola]|nr:Cysteine protease atg4 [Ophidiomyces ophidiicola]